MNFSPLRKEYIYSTNKTYFLEKNKEITYVDTGKKNNLRHKKYISDFWENVYFELIRIYDIPKSFLKTNQIYNSRYFKESIINIIQPGKNYSNTYTI